MNCLYYPNTDNLYDYDYFDLDSDIPDKYKDYSDYYSEFYQNYLIENNSKKI
jgi:hypothetical protein